MKKHLFTISILVLCVCLISCSKDEVVRSGQDAKQEFRPSQIAMVNEVLIGSRIWMTYNLDVSRYRNGDPIPQVQDPTVWASLTTGAWCYYENNSELGIRFYGKLYNWYAVNDPRGLAPAGYHISTDEEWILAVTYLGGYEFAGMKMKAPFLWTQPIVVNPLNNISGFSGLPGGIRTPDGLFINLRSSGMFWTRTNYDQNSAWARAMYNTTNDLWRMNQNKNCGFSVRCVKD